MLGLAKRSTQPTRRRSAVPGERDLVEHARPEAFGGACHRLAAQRAIEADRGLVVGQSPDHQALQPALLEVAARGREQPPAEAQPLKLGTQVELVDLAVIVEAAGAVASVIGISGDTIAERENGDPAALADGAVPPLRTPAVDELVELGTGDDALVSALPGFVVSRCNRRCIRRLCATNFDEDRAHVAIEASTTVRIKSYV